MLVQTQEKVFLGYYMPLTNIKDNITLDFNRSEVIANSERIPLNLLEMRTLGILVLSDGAMLTAEELRYLSGEEPSDNLQNKMTQRINRIRTKLGFKYEYIIEPVHGTGFRYNGSKGDHDFLIGSMAFSSATRTLTWKGIELYLPPREFDRLVSIAKLAAKTQGHRNNPETHYFVAKNDKSRHKDMVSAINGKSMKVFGVKLIHSIYGGKAFFSVGEPDSHCESQLKKS